MARRMQEESAGPYFREEDGRLTEIEQNLGKGEWVFHFIVEKEGRPVGFAQYYDVSKAPEGVWSASPAGSAGIDYVVGEPGLTGTGIGTTIVELLVGKITETAAYKNVIADPDEGNAASVRVLEKNGFRKTDDGIYIRHI